jgi:hypothetical protein
MLLAVAAGVVTARVLPALLTAGGRRLLHRGRPTTAAAFLSSSRRGTTRWLVPIVTVGLALIVVTTDALAVGVRNWSARAEAEVGAASVLTLASIDLTAVAKAVQEIDPLGDRVTPVAVVSPTEQSKLTTIGVVPESFRRIALWPGVEVAGLAWDRLTAPTVPPLVITGTRVTYHVEAPAFEVVRPAARRPPTSLTLALRVVRPDGSVDPLPLSVLPEGGVDGDQEVPVDCAAGCRISGIGVLAAPSTAAVTGSASISRFAVNGRPVDLAGVGSWRDVSSDDYVVTGTLVDQALRLDYANNGSTQTFLIHASVPDVVPTLTTPTATPTAPAATFSGSYVDGSSVMLRSAGTVTFVPGGPAAAGIVHLDNLLAQGWRSRGATVLRAYVDSRDPAYIAQVTSALAERGIPVVATTHASDLAAGYGATAAAWSLQLAAAVGVLSLLVVAAGIVVLASTSSRARRRDYAGLRLVGQRRRERALLAQLETVPVIVVSAVLGVAVGLWAAPPAVGMMPLFTTPPPTYPLDLRTAYQPALIAGLAGLVILAVVGAITSLRVARRADLQRLRDAT